MDHRSQYQQFDTIHRRMWKLERSYHHSIHAVQLDHNVHYLLAQVQAVLFLSMINQTTSRLELRGLDQLPSYLRSLKPLCLDQARWLDYRVE